MISQKFPSYSDMWSSSTNNIILMEYRLVTDTETYEYTVTGVTGP